MKPYKKKTRPEKEIVGSGKKKKIHKPWVLQCLFEKGQQRPFFIFGEPGKWNDYWRKYATEQHAMDQLNKESRSLSGLYKSRYLTKWRILNKETEQIIGVTFKKNKITFNYATDEQANK